MLLRQGKKESEIEVTAAHLFVTVVSDIELNFEDTLAQTYNGFAGCVEWLLQIRSPVKRQVRLSRARLGWSVIEG